MDRGIESPYLIQSIQLYFVTFHIYSAKILVDQGTDSYLDDTGNNFGLVLIGLFLRMKQREILSVDSQ